MSFFCIIDGALFEAKSSVSGFGFELNIEDKDKYVYPINGWYYFDTKKEASEKLNIIECTKEDTGNRIPKLNLN